jgi:hypothetical protein
VLVGGCGGSDRDAKLAATAPPTVTSVPSANEERMVAIYEAVVRRLVKQDNTFGGEPSPFRKVFLLDAPAGNAGHPTDETLRSEPFSEAVRRGLRTALTDLPPVQFVTTSEEGRTRDRYGNPQPREAGVIITLGPITGSGDRVRVPNGLWCGGACGQWLTYVVNRTADGWRVSGNTGEVAIS